MLHMRFVKRLAQAHRFEERLLRHRARSSLSREAELIPSTLQITPRLNATYFLPHLHLHLRLDFLKERLQLVHIRRLLGPANTETLRRVRLGDLEPCQSQTFLSHRATSSGA
jgi:hypothetical protein